MNTTLKALADWLEANTDKEIRIRKREQDDTDEVRIGLEGFELSGDRTDAIDDYTKGSALVLRGSGSTATDNGEAPLPSDTFEIPLEGLAVVSAGDGELVIRTERARYELTLA